MSEEKNFAEDLARELRKKKIRKYALAALAVVIIISTAVGLNVENKDSLLPDGQGNIVTNEQVVDDKDDIKQEQPVDKEEQIDQNQQVDIDTSTDSSDDLQGGSGTSEKPSAEDLKVDNTDDPTASNDGNSAYKPDEAEKVTVTISIRCDTLSSDMSKLTNPSIAGYIPSNGVILSTTTYKGTTDNTVFDALNTVCRNNGIQLESSYTPMYESYYVEGINYLYEFDGGVGSGWMYKVNGWYPNYGCSSYYLSDGDVIEWVYTCDYGVDVGGELHNY